MVDTLLEAIEQVANMQKAKKKMTEEEMLKVPFERRAGLFKDSVERAAKRFMVELTSTYIQSHHDYHVAIKDKVDEHNEVYYNTLTQEE